MVNSVYANARAKAKESKLLGQSRLNRMIDAKSADEAFKILMEVGFGNGVSIESVTQFETLLFAEEDALCAFIRECAPNISVMKYLLTEYDYKNAEIFVKEKYLKIFSTDFKMPNGIYKADVMKEKIMVDDYQMFDEILAKTLIGVDEMFVSGNLDGMRVNALFEKNKFKEMLKVASKNKILKKLCQGEIDCANITACLRARDFSVKDFLMDGGTLSVNDLRSLCEDSFDTLREKFSFNERKEFILSAIESAEHKKPLSEFEKKANDFALESLLKYKYDFEGIAPFLLYVYYKRAEIFNVRLILVSLLNNIPSDEIKKRLRVSYAG